MYIYRDDLKTAYPKSVKFVKNMSKIRFLKPRLFKQKLLNGRERQTKLANFATFFLDCLSDGKNLEDISSFGRDLKLIFQFQFLFKQSRF